MYDFSQVSVSATKGIQTFFACCAAKRCAKYETFHLDALEALGLNDCAFNSQTREIDSSSSPAGEDVLAVCGSGGTSEPSDQRGVGEGTVWAPAD